MKAHCPGCHGHIYDEHSDFDSCAEHGRDDDRPDCPGCQECERLRADLLSVRESLQRERAGQVKCNSGHVSDRALWDCPVCVEAMRGQLAVAKRLIKKIGADEDFDEALAAWEEGQA